MSSLYENPEIPSESELSRRESLYQNWPVDEKLSVWIEIVRHMSERANYEGDDYRFMLDIFSILKHTLPDYDWPAADAKLEKDVSWHLGNFNMPAWNRIVEKLMHDEKCDTLQVAMEQLIAYKVKSPRLPGPHWVQFPLALDHFKFPVDTRAITMENVISVLCEIINEVRESKNKASGYTGQEELLKRMTEIDYIVQSYKEDLEDLKARLGVETDDQNDFLNMIHSRLGI